MGCYILLLCMCVHAHIILCNIYAKQNTLGVKKKQHASRQVQPKALISVEAKKLSKNF